MHVSAGVIGGGIGVAGGLALAGFTGSPVWLSVAAVALLALGAVLWRESGPGRVR